MANVRNTAAVVLSSLGMFLVVGCAPERHEEIPKSARLVADGNGKVDFIAPSDGMAYVYDRSAGELIYSGRVMEGERLEVEPMEDRIVLNGRTVMDKQIRDANETRIFFRSQPRPAGDTAGSRTRGQQQQQQQPQNMNRDGQTQILVQPRENNEAQIRVTPGANDSKITVQPGEEGSKVIIEGDGNRR